MAPPMYQYRIVLVNDDKLVNVATDMDFNIEGDIKVPVNNNLSLKSKMMVAIYFNWKIKFKVSFFLYFWLF